MSVDIGIVTTIFNRQGRMISAQFVPSLKVFADSDLLSQFDKINVTEAMPIRVRSAGESLISKFFNDVTYIELSDREKFFIDSEVVGCKKHKGIDVIKKCVVKFVLRERGN